MSSSEQKTLKEILNAKMEKLGRFTRCLTNTEIEECVKEWLKQKGLEIGIEDPDGNLFLSKKALLEDLEK